MPGEPRDPSIAFVVATLDEAATIEQCLRSLVDQDYPADRLQVAVVDGGSIDGTREIVRRFCTDESRVALYANPRCIAAAAFNIGVDSTRSDIISLASAHSTLDAGYARVLADAFVASGASLVGGRKVADAGTSTRSPMAAAIVRATSSPLGLGSAGYHYSEVPGWVDTAFPGAYRRELLSEIGGFDESLVRNQDDELHLRARIAGHPMWYEPRLRSTYRPRPSLTTLWRQYYEYGWWRVVTVRKHRRVASLRHLAPAALVAGLVAGPTVALLRPGMPRWWSTAWGAGTVGWFGWLAAAGWRERGASDGSAPYVPLAVACLHLAYGSGFWLSLLEQVARRDRPS